MMFRDIFQYKKRREETKLDSSYPAEVEFQIPSYDSRTFISLENITSEVPTVKTSLSGNLQINQRHVKTTKPKKGIFKRMRHFIYKPFQRSSTAVIKNDAVKNVDSAIQAFVETPSMVEPDDSENVTVHSGYQSERDSFLTGPISQESCPLLENFVSLDIRSLPSMSNGEVEELSTEGTGLETPSNETGLEDSKLISQRLQSFVSNEISAYLQDFGTFSVKAKTFFEWLYLQDEPLNHADKVFIGYESETPNEPVYLALYSTVVPDSARPKLNNTFKIIHRSIGCISEEAKVISDMEIDRNLNFSEEENKRLYACLVKNTTILLKKHSNLLMVSASKLKSEGYGTTVSRIYDKTCIVLYVDVKGFIPFGETPFPRQIDEFPVDIREGVFKTFSDPKDYHESLVMGCEIVTSYSTCGTLGAFVQLRDGYIGCLTCCHVFETSESVPHYTKDPVTLSHFNTEVYQPAPSNEYKFGNVLRVIHEPGDENNIGIDAALIVLSVPQRYPKKGDFPTINCTIAGFSEENPMIFNSGEIIQSFNDIKIPCHVVKYGAATGLTIGHLHSYGSAVQVSMPSFNPLDKACLHQQLEVISIKEPFAKEGDSGSLVFSVCTIGQSTELKALGLLVGGATNGHVVITPIWAVLDKLQLPLQLFCFDGSHRKLDMSAIENQRLQKLGTDVEDLKIGLSNVNSRLDVISSLMDARFNDISSSLAKREDIEKLIQQLVQTNQNS